MDIDTSRYIDINILKEIPQILEQWWKSSAEMTKEIFSDVTKNISVLTNSWAEYVGESLDILAEGKNVSPVWLIVPVTFVFALTFPLFIRQRTSQRRLKDLTANIPGPISFPIIGNVPTFARCNLTQFFNKLVKVVSKYGPVVRFWMGDKLYIVISDAESIENLFVNKSLIKKNSTVSQLANGNGVVPDDDKWKIHRRIISSTFNSNVLEQFMDNFAKNSLILSDNFKSQLGSTSFDIYSHICSCALDIICETTMGTNVTTQMEDCGEYKKKLLEALETLGETFQKPWMLNDWMRSRKQEQAKQTEIALKFLHVFVNNVVTEKLGAHRNGFRGKKGVQQVEYVQWVRGKEMTLLDLLLQDDQISVDEVRDELSSLIVAGTKVTAITCCYVLSLLGVHQDVQDLVLEEQEKIFGPDSSRSPTSSDIHSMKYLEQVVKETLRLYPPVPFLFRNIEEDTKLDNGYILPEGSYAVIFNFMTHRNPEYFPNPEVFKPERFSPDKCLHRNPFTFIPFGGGRRICVAYKYGMLEIKTILSTILRKYQVIQTEDRITELDQSLQAGIVLKPANGFQIQITSRPEKQVPSIFREE